MTNDINQTLITLCKRTDSKLNNWYLFAFDYSDQTQEPFTYKCLICGLFIRSSSWILLATELEEHGIEHLRQANILHFI